MDEQTLTQYTHAIPLTINQIPFVLASSLPRFSLALPAETNPPPEAVST